MMPCFSSALKSRKMSGICPASSGPHARHGEIARVEPVTPLDWKVERRVRLLKAHPKGKPVVLVFFEIARCLRSHPRALHLLVPARVRELFRIKPDPRGISKWPPFRLGADVVHV